MQGFQTRASPPRSRRGSPSSRAVPGTGCTTRACCGATAAVVCARLAELTDLPPEFVEDMRVKWGIHLEAAGSKVFDLFR